MALAKGSMFTIDNTVSMTADQKQVIGPVDGNYTITEIFVNNTANAQFSIQKGTYNTSTGVFTSTGTLANNQTIVAAAVNGAPFNAATANGADLTIAAGQYIRIVMNAASAGALQRYVISFVVTPGTIAGAGYPVETTPA